MAMDTQIFNLKLSVYATSAYIVICSLVDEGIRASEEAINARWNDSPENLGSALGELRLWQVIGASVGPDDQTAYSPNPASLWRRPGVA
jgi:hypothetical protein